MSCSVDTERCAVAAEARAGRIEALAAPDRMQPHSRRLPSEAEIERAAFAARQFRLFAEELRAGLHIDDSDAACGSAVDQ